MDDVMCESGLNEIFPTLTEESILLAKKARIEKDKRGTVSTKCPKCHQKIVVDELYDHGNLKSISVYCECGYILDGEIYD